VTAVLDEKLANLARDLLTSPGSVASISRGDACEILPSLSALHTQLMIVATTGAEAESPEAVLTVAQAAEFASVSQSLLYDRHRELPAAIKIGRALRFKKSTLLGDLAALGCDRPRPDVFPEPITNRRQPATPQGARRLRAASLH
jgi:predicted DNA-binding transcriptional regulator AlpA